MKSNLKLFKSYKPIIIKQEDNIITDLDSKIITEKSGTIPLGINTEKLDEIPEYGPAEKKSQEIVNVEEISDKKNTEDNQQVNKLLYNTSIESEKNEVENIVKVSVVLILEANPKEQTNENEGESEEKLAIVKEDVDTTYKLVTDEKNNENNYINVSEDKVIIKIEKDIQAENTIEKYRNIIEDLLNKQSEVKLTEISSTIKQRFNNEKKSVDEIKKIIVALKIEVESVIGKTNTIKRINS